MLLAEGVQTNLTLKHKIWDFLKSHIFFTPFAIKFNKIIGSLTISYDAKLLEPSLFEDAANGRNLDKVASVINDILKDIKWV